VTQRVVTSGVHRYLAASQHRHLPGVSSSRPGLGAASVSLSRRQHGLESRWGCPRKPCSAAVSGASALPAGPDV